MCRRLRRLADEKCASGWKWNRLLCDANRARFSTSDRWFRESDTVAQLLVAAVGRRRHRKRLGSNPFHARPRQTARGVGPARPVPGLPVLYPSHPPPPPLPFSVRVTLTDVRARTWFNPRCDLRQNRALHERGVKELFRVITHAHTHSVVIWLTRTKRPLSTNWKPNRGFMEKLTESRQGMGQMWILSDQIV